MNNLNVSRLWGVFCVLASLVLVGCAAGGGEKKQETLAERAQARWDLLIGKQIGLAWEYLTPGARIETGKEAYIRETLVKPVRWRSARYLSQVCDSPEQCRVKMSVSIEVRSHLTGVGMVGTEMVVTETWLKTDGNWYFLPPVAQ
ncbi:MAG: hypothetical protein R3F22_09865 [Lysobacteraceae bacterium]